MDKLDRLLLKARPKQSVRDILSEDNPYMSKSFDELLDYMSGDNYHAPEMHTREWDKFIYAMVSVPKYGEGEVT